MTSWRWGGFSPTRTRAAACWWIFQFLQIREEIDEVVFWSHVNMCNDSVDILVSQGLEEIAGMVRLVPQERGKRIVVDFVDMPVPQLVQRTVEQMPVRQMLEEAVDVMDVVPRCMVGVQVRQNRDAGYTGETTKWTSGRKALSSPATHPLTQSASGPSPRRAWS